MIPPKFYAACMPTPVAFTVQQLIDQLSELPPDLQLSGMVEIFVLDELTDPRCVVTEVFEDDYDDGTPNVNISGLDFEV